MSPFEKSFKSPEARWRGKPFWSWNGWLEPDELRRQLEVFKKMAMGGVFLHSRVGLETPYLGKEWFDAVDVSLEKCRELGLEPWLYDEDRWPSGYAGGEITKDPRHRMKYLVMELIPAARYRPSADHLGAWQAHIRGGRHATDQQRFLEKPESIRVSADQAHGLTPLGKRAKADPRAGTVIVFSVKPAPCSDWFNGGGYLDTQSPEAVQAFIDATHERYADHLGAPIGDHVLGVFTDEPNYGEHMGAHLPRPSDAATHYAVGPWTDRLPAAVVERHGIDLLAHLPELFLEVEGVGTSRARVAYRDTATALFTQAFMGLTAQWCEQQKTLLTGHVLLEENMAWQTLAVGAAMRHYEPMQAPGIDVLTQYSYEFDTAKQCQSVKHQMGREWMLSELYGCTGWDFPMSGHKAVGDWQAALGVNVRCHHLSWYTMKGEAKRDYPASIFFQSPWWEHYGVVEDYFSRVNVATSEGKPATRLLVIHPIESMWSRYRAPLMPAAETNAWLPGYMTPDAEAMNGMLPTLRDWLLDAHLDFDYGDEDMLSRLAGVHKGQAPALRLGKMAYDAVLVPPLETIRGATLALLERFIAAGGRVVFAGDPAPCVDAEPSDRCAEVARAGERVAFRATAIVQALEPLVREVSLAGRNGREVPKVLYQLREGRRRKVLFFCNTDRKRAHDPLTVRLKGRGTVVALDPLTGERTIVAARRKGEWTEWTTDLPAIGSRIFSLEAEKPKGLPRARALRTASRARLGKVRATQLTEPNAFVLDKAAWRIGQGKWNKPAEILRIDRAVRDHAGWTWRGGGMKQPWADPPDPNGRAVPITLRFELELRDLPEGPLELAIETPDRFNGLCLNGAPVDLRQDRGWWVDPCLRRFALDPALLSPGVNHFELTMDYRREDGLEAFFLLGRFGVSLTPTPVMTAPPGTIQPGCWTAQGLPFYSGSVVYRYPVKRRPSRGERLFISLGDWQGAMGRVIIGGQTAGYFLWPPYEVDVTDHLARAADGPVDVAIEVFGSRRNAFGPLHNVDPDPPGIGPEHYVTTGDQWTEDYVVKPVGMMSTPTLEVRTPA